MPSVQEHYDDLLAEHYTWMLGDDIEQAARGQRILLDQLGDPPAGHAGRSVAVDVGCGSGAQTLALADMGFDAVERKRRARVSHESSASTSRNTRIAFNARGTPA